MVPIPNLAEVSMVQNPAHTFHNCKKIAIYNARLTYYCFTFFQITPLWYNLEKIISFSGTSIPYPITRVLPQESAGRFPCPDNKPQFPNPGSAAAVVAFIHKYSAIDTDGRQDWKNN